MRAHDARDDFAHVVLLGRVGGEDAVDFLARMRRLDGSLVAERGGRPVPHLIHQLTDAVNAGIVVGLAEVHRPADLRMHFRAAKLFGGNLLSDGGLHQRRTGEKQTGALGHQDVIAHHRKIGPSGNTHSHDGGDLRNSHGAHHRVIPEDAAKIVRVGEDVFLQGQEHARGVHQIDRRDAVFDGDVLRADDFLRRHGEKRAGFYRGVVGDDHHQPVANAGQPRERPRCGCAAPFFVHFIRGINAQFKEVCFRINELGDALARRLPPFLMLRFDGLCATALANRFFFVFDFREEVNDEAGILFEIRSLAVDV